MSFVDSNSSEDFDSLFTLSDLDLSPFKKARFISESDMECELEFTKGPNYIPPPTPCNESYKTEDMSSEETLSAGRSEEVKALENIGIETELFGSESTEEDMGGEEVGEGKGEGIPSNILEVKGGRDMCYDVEADNVFEVMGYETECLSRESLIHIVETRDAEVEFLSTWNAKKANQNKYSLNRDEEEEIEKLVKKGIDGVDIMYLANSTVVEAAELYGASSLNEARGVVIPKKPQKKSKTSVATTSQGGAEGKEKGHFSSTSIQAPTHESKGDEVVEFVLCPPPIELDPELKESITVEKRFINSTFPKVDRRRAREEVLSHGRVGIVRHVLEEFFETLKERNTLAKENEDLGKKKEEVEKDLAKAMLELVRLQEENDSLKMKLVFEERKRKMCEEKIEA
ncbi:hypothetical protein SLEP1_g26047 [Rubroshorea leprosula]|uniref:Uncharacterized protein n=1 Tax=Rubroshorea leprosula TaxID=152421 RepID=A0AAV5JYA6_9ROSI|nr:hypothetical protein SLEP1_g26047 [Rubroshorea leprosula]